MCAAVFHVKRSRMGKTTDFSPFKKGLIDRARLAEATVVKTAELTGFS